MSQHSIVAKRYAKALYEVASGQNEGDAVKQALGTVVDLLQTNQEFAAFIVNPNVLPNAKAELIKQVIGNAMPQSLYNVIRLLFDRDRDSILPDLFHAYVSVANEALGRAEAEVYAPYALSDEEQKRIADTFAALTGKQIEVTAHIDPSLLGGIMVRIGDRLYDGSLSGKLRRLQDELNSTQAM